MTKRERRKIRELKRMQPDQVAVLIGAQLEIVENRKPKREIKAMGGGYLVAGSDRIM